MVVVQSLGVLKLHYLAAGGNMQGPATKDAYLLFVSSTFCASRYNKSTNVLLEIIPLGTGAASLYSPQLLNDAAYSFRAKSQTSPRWFR